MVNKAILCTAPGRERLQRNVREEKLSLVYLQHAPAQEITSQLGLQGHGAVAAPATFTNKHKKPHMAINAP